MAETAVVFHRLALREYIKAYDNYAHISTELAEAFKKAIERAVARISEHPDAWHPFGKNFRWVKTHKFPYLLYYRLVEHLVEITAVAHSRRRPGYWQKRRYY